MTNASQLRPKAPTRRNSPTDSGARSSITATEPRRMPILQADASISLL